MSIHLLPEMLLIGHIPRQAGFAKKTPIKAVLDFKITLIVAFMDFDQTLTYSCWPAIPIAEFLS
jgi:hypothetical protein